MSQDCPAASPAKGRALRFFFLLSLVAILVVVGWLFLEARSGKERQVSPPAPGLVIRALRLVSASRPDVPIVIPVRFRSGEEILLNFMLEKPCRLFVGLLDERAGLSAMSPVATDGVAGTNRLGPFEVEDGAGGEALVLVASEKPQTTADFQRLLARANEGLRGTELKVPATLPVILETLRAHEGISAEAVEYEHVR